MTLLKEAVRLTKKPLDIDEIKFEKGDTARIIEVVRYADREAKKERHLKDFAPLLRGANDFKTCQNVWNFVKHQIPYVADTVGYERVRMPNKCIWDADRYRNGGDCKTFTVLTCDLLRELGIKSKIRFISQNMQPKAKHVYTVAILPNGQEVPCDGVYHTFNENPYKVWAWDFDAAQLKKTPQIGNLLRGPQCLTIF